MTKRFDLPHNPVPYPTTLFQLSLPFGPSKQEFPFGGVMLEVDFVLLSFASWGGQWIKPVQQPLTTWFQADFFVPSNIPFVNRVSPPKPVVFVWFPFTSQGCPPEKIHLTRISPRKSPSNIPFVNRKCENTQWYFGWFSFTPKRSLSLGVDSPFFSAIVLFKNRPFPQNLLGFLERFLFLKRTEMEATPRKVVIFKLERCQSALKV